MPKASKGILYVNYVDNPDYPLTTTIDKGPIKGKLRISFRTPRSSIRKKRKTMKLSQQQLADMVGITRVYISNIERGKAPNITLKTARLIAHALSCHIDEIL